MRTVSKWRVGLVCVVLMALLTPAALALDPWCGQSFVVFDAGEVVEIGLGCTLYGQTYVGNTTFTLDGGEIIQTNANQDGFLLAGPGSTIDIRSGIIGDLLYVYQSYATTVYGTDFSVIGVDGNEMLEPGQTHIVGPAGTFSNPLVLTGKYADGSDISIPFFVESGVLNLNATPVMIPEIEVIPVINPNTGIRAYDFGTVDVGQTLTIPNLVYVHNSGNGDLTVVSVQISENPDITITPSDPDTSLPMEIVPGLDNGVLFDITFAPTVVGEVFATVTIVSDDEDEGTIEVILSGTGSSPIVDVDIDIRPDSANNTVNLGSMGVIPVGILSTADFDATQVDPWTVELAGSGVAVRGKGSKLLSNTKDLNGDGLLDLEVKVETENLDPGQFQDGVAVLTGQTYDGLDIQGSDSITIVPE